VSVDGKEKMIQKNEKYLALIRQLIPINELPAQIQDEFIKKASFLHVKRGDFLFQKGQQDGSAFYLLEGEIELQGDLENSVISGGTKGSRYAMAQLQPRQFNAKARTDATVLQILRSHIDNLIVLYEKEQADSYGREQEVNFTTVEVQDSSDGEDTDWMIRMLQSELFSRLPTANIHTLFALLEPLELNAGEVVIRQGDTGEYYYIVKEGRCQVSRKPRAGSKDINLATLGPGDSFGEESLFTETSRNATVSMLIAGTIMRLSKDDFFELIKKPLLQEISYTEALCLVDIGTGQWIDVRFKNEHEESAIAGSRNIPLNMLRIEAAKLPRDRQYIVYCDSGGRSLSAAFLLTSLGFNVSYLAGGLVNNPQAGKSANKSVTAVNIESGSKPELPETDLRTPDGKPLMFADDSAEEVILLKPAPQPAPEPAAPVSLTPPARSLARQPVVAQSPESPPRALPAAGPAADPTATLLRNKIPDVPDIGMDAAEELSISGALEMNIDALRVTLDEDFADEDLDPDIKASLLETELAKTNLKLMDTSRIIQIAESKGVKQAREELEHKLHKERIRIEVAKHAAEMEARKLCELEESKIARKKEEAARLLQKEKKKLELIYIRNAEEMERINLIKQETEIRLRESKEKLERSTAEAGRKMAEARQQLALARKMKADIEKSRAELLQVEETQKIKQADLELKIQYEVKTKLEEGRRIMAEQIANHQNELEIFKQQKAAAEAAREAARKEAQRIIAEQKAQYERDKETILLQLNTERLQLEAEQLKIQQAMLDVQRMKQEAEEAKQQATEETRSLQQRQKQLQLNMNREIEARVKVELKKALEKLQQAKKNIAQAEHAQIKIAAVRKANEQHLREQMVHERKVVEKLQVKTVPQPAAEEKQAQLQARIFSHQEKLKRIQQSALAAKMSSIPGLAKVPELQSGLSKNNS